jgi:hypothetical protein
MSRPPETQGKPHRPPRLPGVIASLARATDCGFWIAASGLELRARRCRSIQNPKSAIQNGYTQLPRPACRHPPAVEIIQDSYGSSTKSLAESSRDVAAGRESNHRCCGEPARSRTAADASDCINASSSAAKRGSAFHRAMVCRLTPSFAETRIVPCPRARSRKAARWRMDSGRDVPECAIGFVLPIPCCEVSSPSRAPECAIGFVFDKHAIAEIPLATARARRAAAASLR